MTQRKNGALTFIVDTREKTPYILAGSKRAALKCGDYSLVGYEKTCVVERKSFADLWVCLTRDRKRFKSQLERLGKMPHAAVVVDTSVEAILLGYPYSSLPGEAALQRLLAWCEQANVPVYFAARRGADVTRALLRTWWKNGK